MWPYHPDLLATPVPRYTSFPTAAEFALGISAARHQEAIGTATGDISLYVHIPFCEKICWYCGCNTAAANRSARLSSYLEALHHEIQSVGQLLPAGTRVRRIAFGGGSPNAISPIDFVRLFDALVLNFPLHEPLVSIELDPRALGREWSTVFGAIGATHASLGVQTFAPHLQEAIGRVQPQSMIADAVELLRGAGITSMNFDLMYGLPGQTMEDVADSLDLTASYGANRVALFGYAHVPHLLPRQRRIDDTALPGPEARFAMAQGGHAQLVDAGYVAVGFDHFALPGDPLAQAMEAGTLKRNFQGFTDDQAPVLIGLGASAISQFPDLLVQNEKNAGRYRMLLSQGLLPTGPGKERSADDRRRGAIIEELLCRGRARVAADIMATALDRLKPYLEPGLARIESGNMLVIAHNGLPYARSIAAAFDPYRQQSARRFSSAI
ncbi:radical SAM protein [Altererythrobacter sp. KTW20L]|uniref:radical SAM protein n=1 Tax=Altererythrobacter sp. KTW20L TaxID=2942210 RepID=UPI0020C0012A|nr:radical SAM protein [Altererythrobacter sp. KTW20L]MCL6251311.1 radical SAM protein [Altererythrobacter sp. KTW20L]